MNTLIKHGDSATHDRFVAEAEELNQIPGQHFFVALDEKTTRWNLWQCNQRDCDYPEQHKN